MRVPYILFIILLTPVAFLCNGCGPGSEYKVVPISGVATWKGEPLPEGFYLTFQPENGRPSEAPITSDGAFTALYSTSQSGVQVGKSTVTLSWRPGTTAVGVGVPQAPRQYADLLKQYGFGSSGVPIEITKKDSQFKVNFP